MWKHECEGGTVVELSLSRCANCGAEDVLDERPGPNEWIHVCGERAGRNIIYARVWKFCPHCGLSQGKDARDTTPRVEKDDFERLIDQSLSDWQWRWVELLVNQEYEVNRDGSYFVLTPRKK